MKTIVVTLVFLLFTLTAFATTGRFVYKTAQFTQATHLRLLATSGVSSTMQSEQDSAPPARIIVIGACLLTNLAILIATLFLWRLFKDDTIEFRTKKAHNNL